MSLYNELFGGIQFKSLMQDTCRQLDWTLEDLQDTFAQLAFVMPAGHQQRVLIRLDAASTLEFMMISMAQYASEAEIPGFLCRKLLLRNTVNRFGFWCIVKGPQYYSLVYMHNAELDLVTPEYFKQVVPALVQECERFDQAFVKLKRQGK